MAVVMKPRRTSTAGLAPTTSNLADGEMGVNIADKKVYVRSGATVYEVANVTPTFLRIGLQNTTTVALPLSTNYTLTIGLQAGGTATIQATLS